MTLPIKNDIDINKLAQVSFREVIENGITPLISLRLIERILKHGEKKNKNLIINEILKNKEYIGTVCYDEGKSEGLRYYKFLKGMKVFLELDCLFNLESSASPIQSNTIQSDTTFCDKTVEKRLIEIYGMSLKSIHSNNFTIRECNKNIIITQEKIEDYIFFKYCWYETEEFKLRYDIYHLEDFIPGFTFNYKYISEILKNQMSIFEMFSDEHNKNITVNINRTQTINDIQSAHTMDSTYNLRESRKRCIQ